MDMSRSVKFGAVQIAGEVASRATNPLIGSGLNVCEYPPLAPWRPGLIRSQRVR